MHQLHPLDLLRTARNQYTQKQLAKILEVDVRTVRRWEVRETDPPTYLLDAIRQRILPLVDEQHDDSDFKFIDLFVGIGDIMLGFEEHGGKCVFTCEWNKFAPKTYLANFSQSSDHIFAGDITEIFKSLYLLSFEKYGEFDGFNV